MGVRPKKLRLSGGSNLQDLDGYQWLGPYIAVGNDTYLPRFSSGVDLTGDDSFSNSDFYKMQFSYSF